MGVQVNMPVDACHVLGALSSFTRNQAASRSVSVPTTACGVGVVVIMRVLVARMVGDVIALAQYGNRVVGGSDSQHIGRYC
jgi:hypothetical protein